VLVGRGPVTSNRVTEGESVGAVLADFSPDSDLQSRPGERGKLGHESLRWCGAFTF